MRFQGRKNAIGSWSNIGGNFLMRIWRDCESKREAKVCCMRDTMDPRWHSVSQKEKEDTALAGACQALGQHNRQHLNIPSGVCGKYDAGCNTINKDSI